MKKVVYSVTKFGRSETKQSGIGYITDTREIQCDFAESYFI